VVLAAAPWWAGEIEVWLGTYIVNSVNPDAIAQFGCAWHLYGYAKGTASPFAVLSAGYPICVTETYGFNAALDGGQNANGYTWAQSNSIGYLWWGWNDWDGGPLSNNLSNPPWYLGTAPNLTTPTNVQLLLQGQNAIGDCTLNGSIFTANHPNQCTIGWKSVPNATSYKIYRNVNKAGYGGTAYATVTAAVAASTYSSYVSSSGSNPHLTTVIDCAYTDLAATQCVSNSVGAAPNYYSNANGYGYRVSAVVGGAEGPQSPSMVASYYAFGTKVFLQDVFNNPMTYNAADGGTTPSGSTVTMKWSPGGGNTYTNPYCGNGGVQWNLNVKAFSYMCMVIKAGQASTNIPVMWPEERINGDYSYQLLTPGGGTSISSAAYGTLANGVYKTIKVPLSVLMTDYTSGSGVQQWSWYKITLDAQATGNFWFDSWYFSET
jgi:hypothetical protein